MPDRPTLEHHRIADVVLDGVPLEVTSAELVYTQYWDGDRPAQREWEVNGRTYQGGALKEAVMAISFTLDGRRLKGRAIMASSASGGFAVFQAVGLGTLTEA